ncbi:hypothetical protein EMGBS1_07190 [Chloroflexota bacterium]|nr:hypothetical protein EMGBS1_07190 [Chloroflexota bacterium]
MRRNWTGRMIAPLSDKCQGTPASFVAWAFRLDEVTGRETLFASAQGLYIAFINGIRVGRGLLTPGWTCYNDRIAYQTYHIPSLLKDGCEPDRDLVGRWLVPVADDVAQAPIYNCWGRSDCRDCRNRVGRPYDPCDGRVVEKRDAAGHAVGHLLRRKL